MERTAKIEGWSGTGDLIRINGVPEMQGWDPEADPPDRRRRYSCAACWAGRLLLAGVVVFWAAIAATMLWPAMPEAAEVVDYLAPTAAQARDTGWIAIMEGL